MDIIKIVANNQEKEVLSVVEKLQNLEIGLIPTDTVYGLVGLASSERVKENIYRIKKRSLAKQLVLQVSNTKMLEDIVQRVFPEAQILMTKFWPGALTLVFQASKNFISKYHWPLPTVAIRITAHPFFLNILHTLNEPLFVTSSNISGEPVVNDPLLLEKMFGAEVDFLVDDGQSYQSNVSTIVDVSLEKIKILREGIIKNSEIMEVLSHNEK